MRTSRLFPTIPRAVAWLAVVLSAGCAGRPYQYGRFHPEGVDAPQLVVMHGGPHERLDTLKSIVQFPKKLLSFGHSHDEESTDESERQVAEYLEKNDLTDVYVSVNDYDPEDQWRRLKENERVAPAWKYTLGAASVVGYTLLPGRVFGKDNYNPFTNTLSLNSPDPNRGLYEAAWAKDVHTKSHVGSYVAFSSLPGISLAREAKKTEDVVGYLQAEEQWELEKQAYPALYAQLGSQSAGLASPFVSAIISPVIGLGGGIVGHTTGRVVAGQRAKEIERIQTERSNVAIEEWLAEDAPEESAEIQLVGGEADPSESESTRNSRDD
ncbi:MAG: hypothetical protein NT069_17660 [Planctomycetota bacterium]|nr:hypothetical protein [Planctomycetota bacterium]